MARADIAYSNLCTTDWGSGGDVVSYTHDANGSVETKDTARDDGTSQTVDYTYNLQNRLGTVTTNEYDDATPTPNLISSSVVTYQYNLQGIRTSKDVDGVTTDYLIDPANHTGYAQALEETTGTDVKCYTIGDDMLAQTLNANSPQYLLYDGHGSTRQLAASDGVTIDDSYSYDAYGVMLGANPTSASPTATNLLYAGEQFDTDAQQYYLRARYYNQNNGRFNQMDNYAGDTVDPQSLHKYLYCHANPINVIDPSGMFSLAEISIVQAISAKLRNMNLVGVYKAYDFADTTITAINLLNQWRSTGRVDYLALSLLAASIIPLGKLMGKVKIGANKLIGASDDLTKLFRKAGSRSRKVVQTIGEMGAELTARTKGFMPTSFDPPYHGFDGIYRNGKRLVIVEAKGGTGKLAKKQMSREWIRRNIYKLKFCGKPANEALARELEQALANGTLDAMVVTTKIVSDQVQDPEFVFKTFAQIGQDAF